jgi:hypothetical protein
MLSVEATETIACTPDGLRPSLLGIPGPPAVSQTSLTPGERVDAPLAKEKLES